MKKSKLRKFFIILFIISVSFYNIPFASAVSHEDYPYNQPAGVYVVDKYNFYQCECTSYVAWCLNERNGISFHNLYKPGTSERLPSSIYNYDTDGSYYSGRWGHANNWKNAAEQLGYTVNTTPAPGAICWTWNGQRSNTGHVAWVSEVRDGNKVVIEQYNGGWVVINGEYHGNHQFSAEEFLAGTKGEMYIHIKDLENSVICGEAMSQGYDRTLPDGDYMIATAGSSDKSTFYYLDIQGDAYPAASEDNVVLCGPVSENPPVYDIWTITYNSSDKFYTIRQKGTNQCLDIYWADTKQGANVQVCISNNGSAQKWAITHNGSNGYRLQPQCSGAGSNAMCLDVSGGSISSGTNIQQWMINNSNAQSWLFIPYQPSQPIAEGRYILLWAGAEGVELDVLGDTGDIPNNTNVQVWNDTAPSQYNSFDFIKLSNGYYKVRHAASGKCLDVTGGLPTLKANVAVHDENDSIAQQWAVVANGSGYSLISRCNGYALDLADGNTANGANVEVYRVLGNANQRWNFVQAEYTVSFDANGGENAPDIQTKYYKADLTLSSDIPFRSGYTFQGWDTSATATSPEYQPGGSYSQDKDITLYAVWKSNTYTITYDPNGGTGAPVAQTINGGSAVLSSATPSRPHHRFLGWAISRTAQTAAYAPGSTYTGGTDITLYAVWERKLDNVLVLPGALTEIEAEAFLQTNADAVMIPAGVVSIGSHAFDDIVLYGYANSEAESYANANGLTFIPITNDWVLDSQMPTGARITAEKWTYTLTTAETITSTEPSLEGWTQAGFTWKKTGDGVWRYAGFPEGFDTGHTLYAKYNKSALPKSKETSATTKREAGDAEQVSYIYWHWTFVDVVNDDNHNVLVEDARKLNVNIYGSVYRDFVYFDAFESTTDYGTVGPGSNGMIDVSPLRYAWRGINEDASQWWWRFEIDQQAYTDYQKLFTYVKNASEVKESATPVVPGENITNVQHWVKYSFAK